MGEWIGMVAVICIFGTPMVAILAGHHRKILEMRLRAGQQADDSVAAEIRGLKQQLSELRDTTTRYDMAFDSTLQRIEARVGHLESRTSALEGSTAAQSRLTS